MYNWKFYHIILVTSPKKLVLQCACLHCAKNALICIINFGHIILQSAMTLVWQRGVWHMLSTTTWAWNVTEAEKGAARMKQNACYWTSVPT